MKIYQINETHTSISRSDREGGGGGGGLLRRIKWPSFTIYDFYLACLMTIQYFYLVKSWNTITCQDPINLWWAIDWTIISLGRIIYVFMHSGYSNTVKTGCQCCLYLLILPACIGWIVMGFLWRNNSYLEDPSCIPEAMVPQQLLGWIVITCLVGAFLLGSLIYDIYELIQVNRELQKYQKAQESIENFNKVQKYSDTTKYPNSRTSSNDFLIA